MEGLSLFGWYHPGVMRAADAGLVFAIRRGGECVDSGLVIFFHVKGTLEDKFTISRNRLALGRTVSPGSVRPQISKQQREKTCFLPEDMGTFPCREHLLLSRGWLRASWEW